MHDALCLRHGWHPPHLSDDCSCGRKFSIDNSLCPIGGYLAIRCNEIQDITAKILTSVCYDVQIEPTLQPLTRETVYNSCSTTDNEARLDIAAKKWILGQYVSEDIL